MAIEDSIFDADRNKLTALIMARMTEIVRDLGSPEPPSKAIDRLASGEVARSVLDTWEGMDVLSRRMAWQRLEGAMVEAVYRGRPFCVRCARCCQTSGPALLGPDIELIEAGLISPKNLFTLRPGEPGYSPQEGEVVRLDHEVVLIKSGPKQGCAFFIGPQTCLIYDGRPLQCQSLECWNPEGFDTLTDVAYLDRSSVVNDELELELIKRQAQECSFKSLAAVVKAFAAGDGRTALRAITTIEADLALRRDASEAGIDTAELDFLFGRPLAVILPALGYELGRDNKGEWTLIESFLGDK